MAQLLKENADVFFLVFFRNEKKKTAKAKMAIGHLWRNPYYSPLMVRRVLGRLSTRDKKTNCCKFLCRNEISQLSAQTCEYAQLNSEHPWFRQNWLTSSVFFVSQRIVFYLLSHLVFLGLVSLTV